MSNEITMPKLSDTMEEGKILHWLKRPGDRIKHGDAIAEVETDKADMVLEAFEDGVIDEIKLSEGESAPVGAVIATLKGGDASASAPMSKAPAAVGVMIRTMCAFLPLFSRMMLSRGRACPPAARAAPSASSSIGVMMP